VTPVHQLPTLEELRSRRREAVRLASRRLMPRLMVTAIAILPAAIAAVLAARGALDRALIVPIVAAVAIGGMLWTGYIMFDYLRRILPDELTSAGLVCHMCGKPLAPAPTSGSASRIRIETKDPDILAAIDGKCPSCGAWVVRDGPAQGALGAGAAGYQPTRNSSSARA
jgi:hypothetical protein